jgi:glycosyltransferase involved in cell wall biosynthesis
MRILLIITDYGSFNNFIAEVAVRLVNLNHDVHVICSKSKIIDCKDKFSYSELGIVFHYLEFPRSFNIFSQLVASKKINEEISAIDPDIINIHFTTALFTTLLYRKPAYFTMGTVHGVGYPKVRNIIKRKVFEVVEKFCFKKLDQIYLINRFDYTLVKQMYPNKAFMYNSYGVGCDFEKFNSNNIADATKAELKRRHSIAKDDFVLAFTGRFVAFKGFDILIKAMMVLSRKPQYKHIKLLLIGGNDPAHSSGLTKAEDDFYKKNRQIIKIGFTADVNNYLAITDLFVFPSVKEGMPVCIMEALAMGVPVVTSDSRGCNDLVEDKFNGLLLSENPTVDEIHDAILQLYDNRDYLKMLASNTLSKRNELNRDMYVNHQLHIYKEAVQEEVPRILKTQYT